MTKSNDLLELEARLAELEAKHPPVPTRKQLIFGSMIGCSVIAAMIGLNHWVFPWLVGSSYHAWFLANGKWMAFGMSLFNIVWPDLDRCTGLIDKHPLRYLSTCCWLVALPMHVMGAHLRREKGRSPKLNGLDVLLGVPWVLVLTFVLAAWIFIAAPAQYLIHLVAGAPARLFVASEFTPLALLINPNRVSVEEVPKSMPVPRGWTDVGLAGKPVTFTAFIAGILLTVVEWWLVPSA